MWAKALNGGNIMNQITNRKSILITLVGSILLWVTCLVPVSKVKASVVIAAVGGMLSQDEIDLLTNVGYRATPIIISLGTLYIIPIVLSIVEIILIIKRKRAASIFAIVLWGTSVIAFAVSMFGLYVGNGIDDYVSGTFMFFLPPVCCLLILYGGILSKKEIG